MGRAEDVLAAALERAEAPLPDRIVLAVSGGPDSLVLLHAAAALKKRGALQAELEVASFDHAWRTSSATEIDFVAAQSLALGLRHHRSRASESTLQPSDGGSPEDAARRARYAWLGDLARELGAAWILTAHNADDQLETRLWRLLSGAPLRLLQGIPERRALDSMEPKVELLRPFLSLSRSEIEDELRERGLTAIRDPSNLDPRFLRPRLRAVLPSLFTINPALSQVFSNLAADVSDLRALLDQRLQDLRIEGSLRTGIDLDLLRENPPILRREWLRRALRSEGLKSPSDALLRQADEMIASEPAFSLNLDSKIRLETRASQLFLTRIEPESPATLAPPLELADRAGIFHFAGQRFQRRERWWSGSDRFDRSLRLVVFDAKSLQGAWSLRHPKLGDAMAVLGMKQGRRELRKIFRSAGLSPEKRRSQVLLCLNDEPLWIPGIARSGHGLVREPGLVVEWTLLEGTETPERSLIQGPRPLR